MAQRDNPDDDISFLPSADEPKELTKEELWQLAKMQKRKAVPVPAPPPAPPVVEPEAVTKEQIWSQAKKKKVTIRRLNVGSPPPEMPTPAAQIEPVSIPEPTLEPVDEVVPDDDDEIEQLDVVTQEVPEISDDEPPSAPADEDSGKESNVEKDEAEEEGEVVRLGDVNPDAHKELTAKEKLIAFWMAIGGRSLALSIGIHLVLLAIAGFIVVTTMSEQRIDFLSGGGTEQGQKASQELESAIKRKRMPWTQKTPMQKLAVANSSSALTLPDDAMDLPMPDLSSMMDGSKGGLGFGKMGAGGGFGNGIGAGGKSGVTFQPLMMFGKKLGGKKLAVILDVSGSMLSELPKVVREADRVANGSVIVCFNGCGLSPREGGTGLPERAQSTGSGAFKKYWEELHGPKSRQGPDPTWDVFDLLQRRRGTYFVDILDIKYTWLALISDEVRTADTLYWFSDFLDAVEDRQMKLVLETMKRRKQRLYVQHIRSSDGIALDDLGANFQTIRKQLVEPSGGEVVEPLVAK